MVVRHYAVRTPGEDQIRALKDLQKEIILHPEKKHRIILKAIKTAKSRETMKAIRAFFKQEFDSD
ncbi:MAG: hypothetical protein AAF693_20125 [Bacteroidota bacterium]